MADRKDAPMSENELRRGAEIRVAQDGDEPVVRGTAIVFDQMSDDLGFREVMLPGSVEFADDVLLDFDHQTQYVLGRQSNGTLDITVDERGVHFEARPPKTSWVNDLLVSMRGGFINQCSFMFRPVEDDWGVVDGEVVRYVKRALVMALSIVSMPAYPQTTAEARCIAEALRDADANIPDEDTGEPGGSPAEPLTEGGSPERHYLAGGVLITLPDDDS